MNVNAIGTQGGTSTPATASQMPRRDEFLRLLVAELQNQDPLAPLGDRDFIGQLTQFSTLEQMQRLNETQAVSLLGRTVEAWTVSPVNGEPEQVIGRVSAVTFGGDGVRLEVEGRLISADQVVQVWA